MRRDVHQGMVQDLQESHLEDQSDSGMGLDRQDPRKEDIHQAEIGHVEGMAVAADAVGLADRRPDDLATVVLR